MRKIIPNILAVIAVLNLVWLFGFSYRIPSFINRLIRNETQSEEAAVTEEGTDEAIQGTEQETTGDEAPVINESSVQQGENALQQEVQEMTEEELTCKPKEGHSPNIRSGPGSEYDIVGAAEENEVMTVTGEEENGWLPVRKEDGTEGYVFSDIVILLDQDEEM